MMKILTKRLTKFSISYIVILMRGIIKIFNLKNDKVFFTDSENVEKDIISIRFKLDLSMYPCKSLQEEYTSLGLELFTIELEREAQDDEDLKSLLSNVEKEYELKNYVFYR